MTKADRAALTLALERCRAEDAGLAGGGPDDDQLADPVDPAHVLGDRAAQRPRRLDGAGAVLAGHAVRAIGGVFGERELGDVAKRGINAIDVVRWRDF